MVARTRTERGLLLVTFSRDGEDPEQQLASGGARALKMALLMIAKRDELRDGDQLTVQHADEGQAG
jgi:hypothetical protein